MVHWPGFTPEERTSFKDKMKGWIDIYRQFDPKGSIYTWIGDNPRPGYGMRLDHIMVNDNDMIDKVDSLIFMEEVKITDHIPIGISINI